MKAFLRGVRAGVDRVLGGDRLRNIYYMPSQGTPRVAYYRQGTPVRDGRTYIPH